MRSRSDTTRSCSTSATGAGVGERRRGLHAERLQHVGLVGLQRLALAGHHHPDHAERLTGGVEREEEAGAQSRVDELARDPEILLEVGDELGSVGAGDHRDDRVLGGAGVAHGGGAVAVGERRHEAVGIVVRPRRNERRVHHCPGARRDERQQVFLGPPLEYRAVELHERLEPRAGLMTLGAVARDLGEAAERAALVAHGRQRGLGPEQLAVAADPPSVALRTALGGGALEIALGLAGRDVFRQVEHREVPAEDLVGRATP